MSDVTDRVVGIIEHNTGHKQPNGIDLTHIMVHATHAQIDREDVEVALQKALGDGRVEEVEPGRYAVAA